MQVRRSTVEIGVTQLDPPKKVLGRVDDLSWHLLCENASPHSCQPLRDSDNYAT